MNTTKILKDSTKLANKAQDGVLIHNDNTYTLTFSQYDWTYTVKDSEGFTVIRINEKTLAKAKKFLKFWLEN